MLSPGLPHRDNDISLFLPRFDIPMSLGCLFQRIAFIDDGFVLPRFDQFLDEREVFRLFARQGADDFRAAL